MLHSDLSLSTRHSLMQAIRVLAKLEWAPSGRCVALERAKKRVRLNFRQRV